MLHAPHLPPKHMRHHFWAQRAPIQHRSRGNSATAAPAPTLLSATQHLPASDHDAAVQSCCGVSPMLHAPHLPPKHMRHHFWAQRAPIPHRSRGNSAAAATAPTLLSATQRLPASDHDAAAQSCCGVSPMLPARHLPPKQMHWIFCADRPSISIAHAAIQRPRHQHPYSSLRHSICLHPSTVPYGKAAAECLRCFMRPICPRNTCATISGRNSRRYSIAHAVVLRPRHLGSSSRSQPGVRSPRCPQPRSNRTCAPRAAMGVAPRQSSSGGSSVAAAAGWTCRVVAAATTVCVDAAVSGAE